MDINTIIKEARLNQGLKLNELSKRSGLGISYIYSLERRVKKTNIRSAKKLSDALGLDIDVLLSEEDLEIVNKIRDDK